MLTGLMMPNRLRRRANIRPELPQAKHRQTEKMIICIHEIEYVADQHYSNICSKSGVCW